MSNGILPIVVIVVGIICGCKARKTNSAVLSNDDRLKGLLQPVPAANKPLMIKRMLEIAELTRWGVGVAINANAVEGVVYGLELLHIKEGTLAGYCAPGIIGTSDIGAGIGFSLIKTFGCKSNEDYTGNFLTVAGSVSLGAGSFSWGANFDLFLTQLEQKQSFGLFDSAEAWNELGALRKWWFKQDIDAHKKLRYQTLLCIASTFLEKGMNRSHVDAFCKELMAGIPDKLDFNLSLTHLKQIESHLQENGFDLEKAVAQFSGYQEARFIAPNFFALLDSFTGVFSGCNSAVIGAGVGLGVSMVGPHLSVSIPITHYTMAFEIDFRKYLSASGSIWQHAWNDLRAINKGMDELEGFCADSRFWMRNDVRRFFNVLRPQKKNNKVLQPVFNDFDNE